MALEVPVAIWFRSFWAGGMGNRRSKSGVKVGGELGSRCGALVRAIDTYFT